MRYFFKAAGKVAFQTGTALSTALIAHVTHTSATSTSELVLNKFNLWQSELVTPSPQECPKAEENVTDYHSPIFIL